MKQLWLLESRRRNPLLDIAGASSECPLWLPERVLGEGANDRVRG